MKRKKRRSAWNLDKSKVAEAEKVLRDFNRLPSDAEKLVRLLEEGRPIRSPLRSEPKIIASLFESLKRGDTEPFPLPPNEAVLRRLVAFRQVETDVLTDQDAPRFANALLALSAHEHDWVRPLESWRARTHNAGRQFHSLLRHLIATYNVPTFMDVAWLAGLTTESVKYQDWYKHIARGHNIRSARELPIPLSKRQAHAFICAPDDFDIPTAFRWATVIDNGGDERLVRSLLGTRIGTAFDDEEFWNSVNRFFIAHPELEPIHHGPIVDYLHNQRFVPSVPNPLAGQPGEPSEIPPQPNLCMKGRTPDSLKRAISRWHFNLAQGHEAGRRNLYRRPLLCWRPSGISPFAHEEEVGEDRRTFESTELLGEADLIEEGKAMGHCVASYSQLCASGRSSIWSLRMRIPSGRIVRLATVELRTRDNLIVQVRKRANKPPTVRELSLLSLWSDRGGPTLASWLAP
jgi:hypothetical protein